jgi:hypothetical protein
MVFTLRFAIAVALLVVAPPVSQASDTPQQQPPPLPAPRPEGILLSVSRCSTATDSTVFPLDTVRRKPARRPIGTATVKLLGRPFVVFGRLVPSTNVAAQMGDLDSAIVGRATIDPIGSGYGPERAPKKRRPAVTIPAPAAATPPFVCESP